MNTQKIRNVVPRFFRSRSEGTKCCWRLKKNKILLRFIGPRFIGTTVGLAQQSADEGVTVGWFHQELRMNHESTAKRKIRVTVYYRKRVYLPELFKITETDRTRTRDKKRVLRPQKPAIH